MNVNIKAGLLRFPHDMAEGATANDFGVAKVSITSTHDAWRIPHRFSGRSVHLYVADDGAYPRVAISRSASAEVSTGAAASGDNDVSLTAGAPIAPRVYVPAQMPTWLPGDSVYLIHESAVDCTLEIWLADGY